VSLCCRAIFSNLSIIWDAEQPQVRGGWLESEHESIVLVESRRESFTDLDAPTHPPTVPPTHPPTHTGEDGSPSCHHSADLERFHRLPGAHVLWPHHPFVVPLSECVRVCF
jgi:hypothetical protein